MAGTLTADDRHAIHELIYGYAWALDTGDVDGFVSCFSEDALLVWDAFEEPTEWRGAEELRGFASFLRDLPTTAGRQHHVSNIIVRGDNQAATAVSYVTVVLRQGDGPHPTTVMGWYDDAFVRLPDGWRIARRVIRDWSGPVLAKLAGQTGERVVRPRPAALAGMKGRGAA
ncbi:MAG TPA: nuclear transport factor 2 family protein [Sphingomonadaceae bacterium]|nr:nuclear transport factor 2 family protein [Sphingomonadaceae bacterium]